MKIYTELDLIKFGYPIQLLIPYIGLFNKEDENGAVMFGRFDRYLETGKNFIELTALEDSEVCLLPFTYDSYNPSVLQQPEVAAFLEKVEKSRKKILVFAGHDVPINTIPIKNAVVFNSAISASTKGKDFFSWPHFFEDFIQQYADGQVVVKMKSAVPVVGFCGYAPPLAIGWGKEKIISLAKLAANYLGIIQKYPSKSSHSYRARAIIGLKRSKNVKLNLRLKGSFAFGPEGRLNTGVGSETHLDFRKNFVNNIIESDYTLCVRGIGNNSVRFFETICCGRIPVFVNTDSVLPFDHIINWKELCVWVEEKDIDKIGEKVKAFHEKITEEDFAALQMRLRKIWEEYFSPVGFYKHLSDFV